MRALAKLGATGSAAITEDEAAVLKLANEFRRELCMLHYERHIRTIDLRNDAYPELYSHMVQWEHAKLVVVKIEKLIKQYHSDVRDRNALTDEMRQSLKDAEDHRDQLAQRVQELKQPWSRMFAVFSRWLAAQADWKDIKSLPKRRVLYGSLPSPTAKSLRAAWEQREWELSQKNPNRVAVSYPRGVDVDAVADYLELYLDLDLRERELSKRYQDLGLHSAIRGEIVEASQPKLGKDKPGILYRYGREPEPATWSKLTLQFPGGLSWQDALAGKQRSLVISRSHRKWYRVRQQIGTARCPRYSEYLVHLDRDLLPVHHIRRWTLVIDAERRQHFSRRGWFTAAKRRVVPIIAELNSDKPQGDGVLTYRLSWTRRHEGVEVCHFLGEHVNERLILPHQLIEDRKQAKETAARTDLTANQFLATRGIIPAANEKQGVEALRVYAAKRPDDDEAAKVLDTCEVAIYKASRVVKRAIRTIESIYATATARICELHSHFVKDPINLTSKKRYKTRDLKKQDAPPTAVRELRTMVAPGKLQARIKGYGLATVKKDDAPSFVGTPETNLLAGVTRSLVRGTR